MKCYYSEPVYDKHGLITGVSCKKDNFRFIDYDTAIVVYCGAFAEKD